MSNKLAVIEAPELAKIEPSRALAIKKTFEPMYNMLDEFESAYNEIIAESQGEITPDIAAKAKRLRLDMRKVRTGAEKIHKEQKKEALLEGRAIDGVRNILKWAVDKKETELEKIEKHAEIQEKKRLDELQLSRAAELSQYINDAHERQLSHFDDDVWAAYLGAKKTEYNDRLEAEKAAELARIEKEKAEAAERERIRLENERLKAEAKERERVAKIEADKRAKVEAARIKKEKAEQEKREKEQREQQRKIEAQRQKEQEEIRAERAKIEAEAKERERVAQIKADKIEAEAKKERERVAAEQAKIEAQQREIEAEKERRRIAKEKADAEKLDKELQAKRIEEATSKLIELDTDQEFTPENVVRAIVDGFVPWVRFGGEK